MHKNTLPRDPISETIAAHSLALDTPADFLLALHFASHWPARVPIEPERWARQLALVDELHPLIFDPADGLQSAPAVWMLFFDFDGGLPASTFAVFRLAFNLGLIGPVAYGAALRCVLCVARGAPLPWLKPDSIEARCEMAAELAMASPTGLMRANELEEWRALPPTVTIYRGGCSNHTFHGDALRDGSMGIYWTPSLDTARYYLARRAEQRRADGGAGWPFLIAAEVPRSAVCGMGLFGDLREAFVNFEAVDPALVRCALPPEVLAA